MSELLSKAQEQFLVYRILIIRIVLTMILTFALAWHASMAQVKWSELDGDEQFYTACGILALMGDKLLAFLDKTAALIAKGKLPGDADNGTTFVTKSDVQQTTEIKKP